MERGGWRTRSSGSDAGGCSDGDGGGTRCVCGAFDSVFIREESVEALDKIWMAYEEGGYAVDNTGGVDPR